ncbi:MAG: peptide-methionine (S)-S-oxide reductase MsrA [Rothia sp. (in: high G+C Gram-positive bacteria)]|uniref:peptide-methionine (S)-S-oxide reductase MsrA n=1 Tax=Rothia sp. (in: high G+C Gram-positive bacteria) TaxID=1885016 RepID=UPI0026E0034A|nr:peptide-methionine (S)-S-oxide reductase MsrA [Rothia sp. (in: high G+C Gram-positive bacteria)]MDO5750943.1 peptide-methionine (S)-S-oxide reductase MsrA [Rothia sp. (in: high G+C Gram-positive bacteria)]
MATQSFVLGGGCFWCLDAVYRQLRGVQDCVSGYSGGDMPNPDYRSVCSGQTGHHEVVRVDFDPKIISPEAVLDIFFTSHDPTSWDRQGADTGSQYRSVMLYTTEEERTLFETAKERAQAMFETPIVTEIKPLGEFYRAEEYHQDFYAQNPAQGYCTFVVSPKVAKVRKGYAHLLK